MNGRGRWFSGEPFQQKNVDGDPFDFLVEGVPPGLSFGSDDYQAFDVGHGGGGPEQVADLPVGGLVVQLQTYLDRGMLGRNIEINVQPRHGGFEVVNLFPVAPLQPDGRGVF